MNTSQKQTQFIGKRDREQTPLNPNPEKKAKMDLSKLANIIKSMPTKSQEKKILISICSTSTSSVYSAYK